MSLNICFGCSKKNRLYAHCDGSFEHPQHTGIRKIVLLLKCLYDGPCINKLEQAKIYDLDKRLKFIQT